MTADRLARIGAATAMVAHDLNNILAGIDAAAAAARADPETAAALGEIRAGVARGVALIRALLHEGRGPPRPPRARHLDALLAEALPVMARLLPPAVRLIARPGAAEAPVRIDADRFHAALLNLAANAGQAMGPTGSLRVTSAVRQLHRPFPTLPVPGAPMVPPGRWAVVSLRDSGPGIAPELAARLFTPFVTTRAEGTGLGLLAVRETMQAAGGHLALGGAPGRGLVARLFLPLPAAPPADTGAIWLVEDEAPLRRLMARALRQAGWRIAEADSAETALALPPARPAWVVADLTLPGMDGLRLLRALRRRWPGLGCVLISGYDSAGGATPAGTVFLRKPFALAALVAAVGPGVGPGEGPGVSEREGSQIVLARPVDLEHTPNEWLRNPCNRSSRTVLLPAGQVPCNLYGNSTR